MTSMELMYRQHMLKLHQKQAQQRRTAMMPATKARRRNSPTLSAASAALANEYENRLSEWRKHLQEQQSRRTNRSALVFLEPADNNKTDEKHRMSPSPTSVLDQHGNGYGDQTNCAYGNDIDYGKQEDFGCETKGDNVRSTQEPSVDYGYGTQEAAVDYGYGTREGEARLSEEAPVSRGRQRRARRSSLSLGMSASLHERGGRQTEGEAVSWMRNSSSTTSDITPAANTQRDEQLQKKSEKRGRRARRMSMSYQPHNTMTEGEEANVAPVAAPPKRKQRKRRTKLGSTSPPSVIVAPVDSDSVQNARAEVPVEEKKEAELCLEVPEEPEPPLSRRVERRRSSLKSESSFCSTDSAGSKTVRFDTHAHDDDVSVAGDVRCSVTLIEKSCESFIDFLWWSESELDQRCRLDTEIASLVDKRYDTILCRLRQSVIAEEEKASALCDEDDEEDLDDNKIVDSVELCFNAMHEVSSARGLEAEVCEDIVDRQEDHRRAVLSAQKFLRSESDVSSSAVQMVLRRQSLKYSRASQLTAAKIASFDRHAVLTQ